MAGAASLVFEAAESDQWSALDLLLVSAGDVTSRAASKKKRDLLDYRNDKGETALHRACFKGYAKTTATLLRHGADVLVQDAAGKTPAMHAMQNGRRECLELLLTAVPGSGDTVEQQLVPELKMRANIAFDPARFKPLSLLGSGSFGTVTLAEYQSDCGGGGGGSSLSQVFESAVSVMPRIASLRSLGARPDSPLSSSSSSSSAAAASSSSAACTSSPSSSSSSSSSSACRLYALKSIPKSAVAEAGHIGHVMAEKNILLALDSPFCLKLFGVYQTPAELVMVSV